MSDTVVCSHCRTEVPFTARRCPNCLENPYGSSSSSEGGFINTLFTWLLIVFVVYFLSRAVFG
jgi:predicted amidophosphoribosyltransferase